MKEPKDITVHVPFASSPKGPYKADYPRSTPANAVLTDALEFFGIQPDGGSRYYFLVDGVEVPLDASLDSLVDGEKDHTIKLPLRTETISG